MLATRRMSREPRVLTFMLVESCLGHVAFDLIVDNDRRLASRFTSETSFRL
jgi:hypothetical protein